jgi:hypothetical protein
VVVTLFDASLVNQSNVSVGGAGQPDLRLQFAVLISNGVGPIRVTEVFGWLLTVRILLAAFSGTLPLPP